MIYILSDLHGGNTLETIKGLEKYIEASNDDLLIILGDLGLNFYQTEDNKKFTEWFLNIKKNIAFVDGNHENFDYINSFPIEKWCEGNVHRLSKNIVHLMRGNIYNIQGFKFFVMGGCKSSQKWIDSGMWYSQEEPSESEIKLAYENLEKNHYNVDFVLTHKYKKENAINELTLQGLTNFIDSNVDFSCWYSGHWHENKKIDNRHIVVYDELLSI